VDDVSNAGQIPPPTSGSSIFEQPTVHGEVAPAPSAPMPHIPVAPPDFVPPAWPPEGESGATDAASGVDAAR
jgi:hypothetical protein